MNLLVETPNEILASVAKPELQTIAQIDLSADDCLVICAGFEERALGVLKNALLKQGSFTVILISYEPHIEENREKDIHDICAKHNISIKEIRYSRENPEGFGQYFVESVNRVRGNIVIDISAMSRLLIVQILVALSARDSGFANVWVTYVEALEYPPSQEEARLELSKSESDPTFSILFLSSGVYEVTILPELSSSAPSGSQTRLIAFPSLDAHHLTAVRAEIQPSRLTIIDGTPPDVRNQWRQGVIAEVNKVADVDSVEKYQTSTLDYRQTLDCLLDIYNKHGVYERLLISPTGSKMQTIAVAILRSWLHDVQIVYPSPQGFCRPSRYTLGIGALHLLSLSPFSSST